MVIPRYGQGETAKVVSQGGNTLLVYGERPRPKEGVHHPWGLSILLEHLGKVLVLGKVLKSEGS